MTANHEDPFYNKFWEEIWYLIEHEDLELPPYIAVLSDNHELQSVASIDMQRIVRGHCARTKYHAIRQSILKRVVRSMLKRRHSKLGAVATLQRIVRGGLGRRHAKRVAAFSASKSMCVNWVRFYQAASARAAAAGGGDGGPKVVTSANAQIGTGGLGRFVVGDIDPAQLGLKDAFTIHDVHDGLLKIFMSLAGEHVLQRYLFGGAQVSLVEFYAEALGFTHKRKRSTK